LKNEFCGFCGSQCCESATEHPNVMCMKSERTGEAWIRDGGGGGHRSDDQRWDSPAITIIQGKDMSPVRWAQHDA